MAPSEDRLAEVSFFTDLPPRLRGDIAALMTPLNIRAGRTLAEEGTVGREFFVIERGTAEVTQNGRVVSMLGPGDHFGEIALLHKGPRTASVTATSDMTVEVLTRSEFADLLDRAPELTGRMMQTLAGILEERAQS